MSRTLRDALLALAVLVAAPALAPAACNTNICACDGPGCASCTITGANVVDHGCTLDFGTKNVTIAKNAVVRTSGNCNVGEDEECPSFTLRAQSLLHRGRLAAPGGELTIEVRGDFRTEDVAGADEGGVVRVDAPNDEEYPGILTVRAGGAMTIGTRLSAVGGLGEIDLSACSITLAGGTIDADTDGEIALEYRDAFVAQSGAILGDPVQSGITCRDVDATLGCDSPPQGAISCTATHCNGGGVQIRGPLPLDGDDLGACAGCGNHVVDPGEACDDGNVVPCDGCSPSCAVFGPGNGHGASCEDGDPCTTGETCSCNGEADCASTGDCTGGRNTVTCDDGNACTFDWCQEDVGCLSQARPPGFSCSDGNACNGEETCAGGTCVAGTAPSCDDGNACTTDVCDPAAGCRSAVSPTCAAVLAVVVGDLLADDCRLDVDGNGAGEVATDVVYIARRKLGLGPVPPSFRTSDPAIPADAVINARIDALGPALDVDGDGTVSTAGDVVYVARTLLGLTPVPPSFRTALPSIPSDVTIGARVRALCR